MHVFFSFFRWRGWMILADFVVKHSKKMTAPKVDTGSGCHFCWIWVSIFLPDFDCRKTSGEGAFGKAVLAWESKIGVEEHVIAAAKHVLTQKNSCGRLEKSRVFSIFPHWWLLLPFVLPFPKFFFFFVGGPHVLPVHMWNILAKPFLRFTQGLAPWII